MNYPLVESTCRSVTANKSSNDVNDKDHDAQDDNSRASHVNASSLQQPPPKKKNLIVKVQQL